VHSRLMPLQNDSLEEQNAQLPALARLLPEARAAAAAGQPPTDEPSFLQWCRAHSILAPAAPDSLSALLAGVTVR
jgi:hypothetical protein